MATSVWGRGRDDTESAPLRVFPACVTVRVRVCVCVWCVCAGVHVCVRACVLCACVCMLCVHVCVCICACYACVYVCACTCVCVCVRVHCSLVVEVGGRRRTAWAGARDQASEVRVCRSQPCDCGTECAGARRGGSPTCLCTCAPGGHACLRVGVGASICARACDCVCQAWCVCVRGHFHVDVQSFTQCVLARPCDQPRAGGRVGIWVASTLLTLVGSRVGDSVVCGCVCVCRWNPCRSECTRSRVCAETSKATCHWRRVVACTCDPSPVGGGRAPRSAWAAQLRNTGEKGPGARTLGLGDHGSSQCPASGMCWNNARCSGTGTAGACGWLCCPSLFLK